MARHLTSVTLAESASRRAMMPENQITFKLTDFLAFANEEMDSAVIPFVMASQEDYFLFSEIIPIIEGKKKYTIPYRAVGNKLNDVCLFDGSGYKELTRITASDLPFHTEDGRVFYIENNQICLTSTTGGSLKVTYYIRPNQLVSEDRVMNITAINRSTGVINVDKIPTGLTTTTLMDVIQVRTPHKCLNIDITPTAIDTFNKTLQLNISDIHDELIVGDYICFAEECFIPQIPTDLHPLLAQRIACRCLEAQGDTEGLNSANAKLTEMESKLSVVINDRAESSPKKLNNRHSILGSRRNFRRR